MPLSRWIISSKPAEQSPAKDAIVNTLYFNITNTLDPIDWTNLGNDLYTLWAARAWARGRFLDIRGYNMDDAEPRPQKYLKRELNAGTTPAGPGQVALCLSYYADRNLPRQRGRLYLGPWNPTQPNASTIQTAAVMELPGALAGLGGVNVDWSLWSPTTQTHTRINHAWVDDSWDIIRSRKMPAVAARKTWNGDG